MLSASIVFASTFLTVFALGLQSLNVNQGHYIAAAATSAAISSGHLWLYRVMPDPSALDLVGYYLGGIVGITASMWFHRNVKAWWAARRAKTETLEQQLVRMATRRRNDEHRDVSYCGLLRRDDTH